MTRRAKTIKWDGKKRKKEKKSTQENKPHPLDNRESAHAERRCVYYGDISPLSMGVRAPLGVWTISASEIRPTEVWCFDLACDVLRYLLLGHRIGHCLVLSFCVLLKVSQSQLPGCLQTIWLGWVSCMLVPV